MPKEADPRLDRPTLDAQLDRAPCGFLSFGDDGRVDQINATLLELLGRERSSVVGGHVEQLLTVPTRIFYQTHWFPMLQMRGTAEEIFLKLRASSGEELGMLVNAVRRAGPAGVRYDCVLMHVRERAKYEDELLRARREADGARAEAEARGRELEDANALLMSQAAELEEQQAEMEEQQAVLEEQTAELEVSSEELQTANDELMERSHELERARAVAEEANQAKSAFLAVMSHELRTPLNAIAGYADLMELGIHGPVTDEQREDLARIKRSQLHLLRLINEVLNLARIESGQIDYDIEDFALAEIVGEVRPMVETQVEAKGLSLRVDVAPEVRVRADREKVLQVLLNLLSNAIKFTPEGGSLELAGSSAASTDELVAVTVADSGIGIPANRLDAVFEPFVQVDVSRTSRKEGTGLGLAISRDLARGMGGDLRVESRLGQGSTFTFEMLRGDGAS